MRKKSLVLVLAMILVLILVGCNEKNDIEKTYSIVVDNSITRTEMIESTSGILERQVLDTIDLETVLDIDKINFLISSYGEFPYIGEEKEITEDFAIIVQELMNEIKGDNLGGNGANVTYGHKAKIEIVLSNHNYNLRLEFYIDSNEEFAELRVIYSDNQGYVESTTYSNEFENLFIRLLELK